MSQFQEDKGKILGVIGGMGPLATHLFYKMIIEKTQANKDQEHLNMIILNHATMPDRTEAIIRGNLDHLYTYMLRDAKMLEEKGAAVIAIPCNTSHFLVDDLQKEIGIPIIHMIRETVKRISDSMGDCQEINIGILATHGTIKTKLYQQECEKSNIRPIILSEENQERIMKLIYDGVKNGGEIRFEDFQRVEDELLERDCKGAILGCTELSCIKEQFKLSDFYIDAMNVLAEESILFSGKQLKV